uniref:Putative tail protein n=1 Tax=viral metagenome TaxID=1070528 RepID=A0A6M3JRF0_9ZZZZ
MVPGSTEQTTLGTISTGTWEATDIAVLHGGTGASTSGGAQTNLGLAIGTNVQAWDAVLDDLAALSPVATDQFIVGTGAGTYAHVNMIGSGLTLSGGNFYWAWLNIEALSEAPTENSVMFYKGVSGGVEWNAGATARTSLGLAIGTDVLAQQTIGIADNNLVEMDDADAADNDYAKFTVNGLEGRSYAELLSDISVESGAEVNEIEGDGTNGRVLRSILLQIYDGTNANTVKAATGIIWNGDSIGLTDNISKGATTGDFTLSADGSTLTIEASGLTGNCIAVLGADNSYNSSNSTIETIQYDMVSNDIRLIFYTDNAGNVLDLTAALSGVEIITVYILYLTSS